MLAQAVAARRRPHEPVRETAYPEVAAQMPDHARDPVTRRPYAFRTRPDGGFELGARFDAARSPQDLETYERAWAHAAGEWWFVFTARAAVLPDSGRPGPLPAAEADGRDDSR